MTVRIVGATPGADGVVRFADSASWDGPPALRVPHGRRALDVAALFFGDEQCGPVLFLFATPPGRSLPASDPHGHASDTWRMPLRGSFKMGRTEYGPGDARFQRGWRTYPSDNFPSGPDGGWLALLFADRRGTRVQRLGHDETAPGGAEQAVAEWVGLPTDPDREQAVPASLLLTPFGDGVRTGHVNVSFNDTSGWIDTAPGVSRLISRIGAAGGGPVVVLSEFGPDATAPSNPHPHGKIVRLVVHGSCTIDGQECAAGEVRLGGPHSTAELVAGPHGTGLVEVVTDESPGARALI
jgi:hypothetical protein